MRDAEHIKRGPRVATDMKAILLHANGTESEVLIADISKDGFRLRVKHALGIGERVDLRVPKCGDVPAQIRWALGDEAGGVFLAPLPLRAFG